MTRKMSKTTVKKLARIIRQNAQIRAQPDFRPRPEGARRGPPAGPGPLPPFQAERMTGRVGVDPEPWLGAGQPGCPQREHLRLRGRDVVNVDVQVDLLGNAGSGQRGGWWPGACWKLSRVGPPPMSTQSPSTLVTGSPSSS